MAQGSLFVRGKAETKMIKVNSEWRRGLQNAEGKKTEKRRNMQSLDVGNGRES